MAEKKCFQCRFGFQPDNPDEIGIYIYASLLRGAESS